MAERERLAEAVFLTEDTPHILLKTCNRVELYWGKGEISEEIVRQSGCYVLYG